MNKFYLILVLAIAFSGCKSPEARYPISSKSGSFIKASVERNKKLLAYELQLFEQHMAANPEHDYITTENGFWYYYNNKIEVDSLNTPQFGDIVNFNYNVKNIEGDIIYSKEENQTQNYAMDQQEIFTGLREGLKLLKAGETATFLFPSTIAYGYYGDENKIGTNIPLICQVTVNSITENK